MSASKLFDRLLSIVQDTALYSSGAKKTPRRINHHSTFWPCRTSSATIIHITFHLRHITNSDLNRQATFPIFFVEHSRFPHPTSYLPKSNARQLQLHQERSTNSVTEPTTTCLQSLRTWSRRPRSRPILSKSKLSLHLPHISILTPQQ